MYHQLFQAPDDLKGLVKNYFVIENSPDEPLPKEYQSMADGYPEIIIQYNGGFSQYRHSQAYLRSQHSNHQRLTLGDNLGLFGIRLYPHALQHLFNIPAQELVNRVISLNEIVQHDFVQQIIETNSVQKQIEIASGFIRQQCNSKTLDPMYKLVRYVLQSDGEINLPEMRQVIGLSVRQFERRFKAIAGFTPKHYARIMRFQSSKRKYVSQKIQSLTELAQACNYSDQSHFIREFKEFAGMTPAHYFKILDTETDNECQIIKGLIIAKEIPSILAA